MRAVVKKSKNFILALPINVLSNELKIFSAECLVVVILILEEVVIKYDY